jgi:hypothetical protein
VVPGTTGWQVKVPSPDLAGQPAAGALQRWLLPVTASVATGAMLAAAGTIAVTRSRPAGRCGFGPAADRGDIGAEGAGAVAAAAGRDAWSSWVLPASTGGQFGARLTGVLTLPGAT